MQDSIDLIYSTLLDWPIGTLLGGVMVLVTLLVVGLLLAGVYYLFDSVGGGVESGSARVVGKSFTPAYTQTIWVYNTTTKMTAPTYVFHSDCWTVTVDVGIGRGRLDVSHAFYDSVRDGSQVKARFKRGRLSGRIYVRSLAAAG